MTSRTAWPRPPPQAAEAVAACTRALAEAWTAGAPELTAPGSDLRALRAAGDRVAVHYLFHDPACHATHRPADAVATRVYEALEEARLDVLGLRWLPGVALNLMGHPGPERLPLRWLAFEVLARRDAPAAMTDDVRRLRSTLPPVLQAGLTSLAGMVERQPDFARAGAVWADAVASHEWRTVALGGGREPEEPIRGATGGEAAVDPMGTALRSDGGEVPGTGSEKAPHRAPSQAAGENVANAGSVSPGYAAYTTAYDRVVDAASLVVPADLARLRGRLDEELGETRVAATRLTNRLRRALMARQLRHWQFDLDEGWVDSSRLASVVAAPDRARPFRQEADSPFPTAAVTLLVDHSGSMRGRPILVAALTVEILVQALERCGVVSEVLAFTTRDWDGGSPKQEWVANQRPGNPGRLNALEHIVLKAADVPWRRARSALGLVLRDDLLKENVDGEAVQWAHARLLHRSERRRILLVVSDGEPRDEATDEANDPAYLARHLRDVVEDIEDHSPVQIAAVGIGHDVARFYSRAMTITAAEELAEALSTTLISLLTTEPPRR